MLQSSRSHRQVLLSVVTVVLAAGVIGRGAPGAQVYELIPGDSRALIEVGKAGVLSFIAGHEHEVEAPIRGTLAVDPENLEASGVAIEVRTADLKVTGEDEPPEDVPKIQQTMASAAVLDVARYPTITFQSTAIAVRERRGPALDLAVTGDLTLHGQTKSLTVPVHVELATNKIAAQGTLSVKQSDYGITPVTVGGVVSVKDMLTIHFTMIAGPIPSGGVPPTH